MRTIALLMLLTVGAVGQEWPDDDYRYLVKMPYYIVKNGRVVLADSIRPTIITTGEWTPGPWLVSAWDAYAKECWADSTAVVVYRSYSDPNIIPADTIARHEQLSREFVLPVTYRHRTPTFPGFIEWLRRK